MINQDTQQEPHHESGDERVIREGIERALAEGTDIDDRTARYTAGQLHELEQLKCSGSSDLC